MLTPKNSLFLLLVLASITSAHTLSTKQTIEYALAHSPILNQTQNRQTIQKLLVGNARAVFLPSVDVETQHIAEKSNDHLKRNRSNLDLSVTQTLYNNGQNILSLTKEKLNKTTTDVQLIKIRDELIRDTLINLIDLSVAKALYTIGQSNLKLLQTQYKQALDEYHNGLRTEEDVIRFHNNVRTAQIAVLNAQTNVSQTKNALLTLIGMPATLQRSHKISFALFKISEQKLQGAKFKTPNMDKQYEAALKKIQEKINQIDVRSKQRDYWPNLTLNTALHYGNPMDSGFFSSFHGKKTTDWDVTLGLSYNIWDFGTRARNIEIARYEGLSQLDVLDNQLNHRAEEISNNLVDLKQERRIYQISKQLLQSEKNNYARIQQNYREGKLTFLDVINAINDLASAKQQYTSARYNLAKAFYRYQFDLGRIHEEIFH